MTPRFEELHKPKDLHYSDAGSEHLAKKVAESITQALASDAVGMAGNSRVNCSFTCGLQGHPAQPLLSQPSNPP